MLKDVYKKHTADTRLSHTVFFFRAIPYLAVKLSHQLTVAILVSKVHPVTVWVVGVSDIPYWCCSCVIKKLLVQEILQLSNHDNYVNC